MEPLNAFDMAVKIGYECYGEIGKSAFEELELAYVSNIAPDFENSKFRSWTDLNFYWQRSYFKNTIVEDFIECLPASFAWRKIVGATTQTLFGSINTEGTKLVPPMFWGYNMAFIPELFSFLSTADMKDKVNTLNEALEGSEVTRDLLKFGNADQSLIDEYVNGKNGLFFDGRTLRYTPRTSFVICTRPVENKVFNYLEQSGFWSRFHTIQFKITDSTSRDYFTGSLAPTDANTDSLKEILQGMNVALASKTFSRKEPDYTEIQLPILQYAFDYAEKKGIALEADLNEVTNLRLRGDIIREARSYMLIRPELSAEEVVKWTIDRIPHFFDFVVDPLIAPDKKAVKVKSSSSCKKEIQSLIDGNSMKREEIVEAMQKVGFSRTIVDRALKELVQAGLNKDDRYGYYRC